MTADITWVADRQGNDLESGETGKKPVLRTLNYQK